MHEITILRHGESQGNLEGRIQGRSDYPLTELGQQQAQERAEKWRLDGITFDLVIASPLWRARHTAEIVASQLQLNIEYDPLWIERDFGEIEGIYINNLKQQNFPTNFYHPYLPVGERGESTLDLYLRASQALQRVIRKPEGAYLIVAHGAIMTMALYAALGLTPQGSANGPRFRLSNTAYARLAYDSQQNQWWFTELVNP